MNFTMNKNFVLDKNLKIYFSGIGGISLYALALFCHKAECQIAGSDKFENEYYRELQKLNIPLTSCQDGSLVRKFKPDLLVYSAALNENNPDIIEAKKLQIPCLIRGEFLAFFLSLFKKSINICGTHGKTTTTTMISQLLLNLGLQCNVHIGSKISIFNDKPIHIAENNELIINEACEYYNTFLNFKESSYTALTNIDSDHLDFFQNTDNILNSFVEFALKTSENGSFIYPAYGNLITEFEKKLTHKLKENLNNTNKFDLKTYFVNFQNIKSYNSVLSFSQNYLNNIKNKANFYADNIQMENEFSSFDFYIDNEFIYTFNLKAFGTHNIENAVLALATVYEYLRKNPHPYSSDAINQSFSQSLKNFIGADGRLTYVGNFQNAKVFNDYAHHPRSTVATINAMKMLEPRKLYIVYQALTFDRVYRYFDDYVKALQNQDLVLMYPVYSDRDINIHNKDAFDIHQALLNSGTNSIFCKTKVEIFKHLSKLAQDGDIILFLGPEEIRSFAKDLINFN